MSCELEFTMQFLISFVATALGVLLALILQRWDDEKKEAKEAENIKIKLRIELQKTKKSIIKIHKSRTQNFLSPIKMPIYQGFANSAKIALLDRYIWYNDLISLYKYLDNYNAWHDLKTDKVLERDLLKSQKSSDCQINRVSQKVDESLLNMEKTILGTIMINQIAPLETDRELDDFIDNSEYVHKCLVNECENQVEYNGLINCMISELAYNNGEDLLDKFKEKWRW